MSASVPPLGLSNKATSDILPASTSAVRRPFEAELASITLWPEVEKVFGHGYEGGCSIPTFSPSAHPVLKYLTSLVHSHWRLFISQAVRNGM